jgi:hypothetical protein
MAFLIPSKLVKLTPKCKNCKFYLKADKFSKCTKFIMENNNKNVYFEYAEICRMNNDLCGPSGYYFENKNCNFIDFSDF